MSVTEIRKRLVRASWWICVALSSSLLLPDPTNAQGEAACSQLAPYMRVVAVMPVAAPTGVAASGTIAAVSSATEMLVLGLEDPAHPVVHATLPPMGTVCSTSGTWFLTVEGPTVRALDLADPAAPQVVWTLEAAASLKYAAFVGDLCVAFAGTQLLVYDRSSLELLSTVALPSTPFGGYASKFSVQGAVVYLPAIAVDLSDPAHPTQFLYDPAQEGASTAVHGDLLVVVGNSGFSLSSDHAGSSLLVWDLSTPAQPAFRAFTSEFSGSGRAFRQVVLDGRRGFVTERTVPSLHVVDLSDPLSPTLRGSIARTNSDVNQWMAQGDGYVLVASRLPSWADPLEPSHELEIVSTVGEAPPLGCGAVARAWLDPTGATHAQLTLAGQRLFEYGDLGIEAWDVSDPCAMVGLGAYPAQAGMGFGGLVVVGTRIFAVAGPMLHEFGFGGTAGLELVRSIDVGAPSVGLGSAVSELGERLLVVGAGQEFLLYSLDRDVAAVPIGNVPAGAVIRDFSVGDTGAYCATDEGVTFVDFATGARAVLPLAGGALKVLATDRGAFSWGAQLVSLELNGEGELESRDVFTPLVAPGASVPAGQMAAVGDLLLIGQASAGVHLFDISDPRSLRALGAFEVGPGTFNSGVAANADHWFALDAYRIDSGPMPCTSTQDVCTSAPITIGASWDGVSLQSVLDVAYGAGAIDAATGYSGYLCSDPVEAYWLDHGAKLWMVRELAGNRGQNVFGWYAEDFTAPVVDGVDDGVVFAGLAGEGATAEIELPTARRFGFYLDPNGPGDATNAPHPEVFFTNRLHNDAGPDGGGAAHQPEGGDVQCLIYDVSHLRGGVPTYVLAWEDLDAGSPLSLQYLSTATDNDFNDLVVEIQAESPVAAVVADLDAAAVDGGVRLRWELSGAVGRVRFEIQRRPGAGAFTTIGNLEGSGGAFEWVDRSAPRTGRLEYRIAARTEGGTVFSRAAAVDLGPSTVVRSGLVRATPNPFNPSTQIEFVVARAGRVELRVYDVAGRSIRDFDLGVREPGAGWVDWDGRDDAGRSVASGVYVVRMHAEGAADALRVVLLK